MPCAECCYAEFSVLFTIMLSVIILSAVMLSVIMLNVVVPLRVSIIILGKLFKKPEVPML